MVTIKRTMALLCLTLAVMISGLGTMTQAQFIPCRIVNLSLVPPTFVQAGQPFQVTSRLTISCDPSVLPVVRVDLLDAASSKTLSTTSVPYYSYSSSFIVSVTNQATAPQSVGSLGLKVQAYIINAINGQSVAQTSQAFQVSVEPYIPTASTTQTTQSATEIATIAPSTVSNESLSMATTQRALTVAPTSTSIVFSTQTTGYTPDEFLIPIGIVLVGVVVFLLLTFAGRKRSERPSVSDKYCWQCGTALGRNESYCTNCGTKQTKA